MTAVRYGPEYYDRTAGFAERSAAVVVPMVVDLVRPRSVVDVGCGSGAWAAAFEALAGVEAWGVDGGDVRPEQLRIARERFLRRDLREPFDLQRRFDLAVSLEVAEHLPAHAAEAFVSSLARHASVVLFSAAIPYQGGEHHVNEQWPAYWAERFAAHGLRPVDALRMRLWRDDRVAWWYAQNMLLYVHDDVLAERPDLSPEPGAPPALVHPVRYVEWVEWGIEASATPR